MSMPIDPATLLSTAVGLGGGAATVGWITKYLITKYIKDNEYKHTSSRKAIQKIADQQVAVNAKTVEALNALKLDLEIVRTHIGEVLAFRDKVTVHDKNIAVIEHKLDDTAGDLNEGFSGMRRRISDMGQDISDIKRIINS